MAPTQRRRRTRSKQSRNSKFTPPPPSPPPSSCTSRNQSLFNLLKPILVIFIIFFVSNITFLVEQNPTRGSTDIGTSNTTPVDTTQIFDTGFVLSSKLHQFFQKNQFWLDIGALLNTILVIGCQGYAGYMSFWIGDHGLMFRILFAACLRSFCGWFTYLPASPEYLQSNYDFPDALTSGVFQTIITTFTFPVTDTTNGYTPPFVSFFSGHVANTVMVANFMYLKRDKIKMGKFLHLLNVLQIVRLLGSRGHYSIDIIVGWLVAVYVTNPAEKLGSYLSTIQTEKDIDVYKWALEKDWLADIMYAEVNATGGKTISRDAPVRDAVLRVAASMPTQASISSRMPGMPTAESLELFRNKRKLQLKEFGLRVQNAGLVLPNWLDASGLMESMDATSSTSRDPFKE